MQFAKASLSMRSQISNNELQPIELPPLPSRPFVSILAANYNYGAYLEDCIESVLRQSYPNCELIICDDGSTDSSRAILSRYGEVDSRIKIVLQENSGQARALNAAFRVSQGEILCFLDSDDLYAPDKLRAVVEAFSANPNSGFVIHKLLRINSSRSKLMGEIPLAYPLPSGWLGSTAPLDAPWVPPGIPPCTALSLRREVAEGIFPLPIRLRAFADTPIQVLAPLLTPVTAVAQVLGEYRIHGGNAAALSRFNHAHVARLAEFDNELWLFWRDFLASRSCNHPIPPGPPITQNSYAYARFLGDPAAKQIYSRFVAGPRFRGLPLLYRTYWKAADWLPDWAFRKSFELVQGQRSVKLTLAGVLQKIRKVRNATHVVFGANKRFGSKIGKPVGN